MGNTFDNLKLLQCTRLRFRVIDIFLKVYLVFHRIHLVIIDLCFLEYVETFAFVRKRFDLLLIVYLVALNLVF